MSWEARKGRGRYYTRSRRIGGKVVREYLGGGRIGEILAGFDMLKRDERLTEAAELKQSRAEPSCADLGELKEHASAPFGGPPV